MTKQVLLKPLDRAVPLNNNLRTLISGTWQGALAGGLALVGLLLPVDFCIKLNSLLMNLRPLEIVSVYGVAWFIYLGLGLLGGGLLAFAGAAILVLIRKDDPAFRRFLVALIIAIVLARALEQSLVEFAGEVTGSQNALRVNPLVKRALEFAFVIWVAWRHSSILTKLRGFLNAVAVCGACAAGVAILMAALPSDKGRLHPQALTSNGPRPPIILITIDTLSASHMSLYGYHRETTPALSRMASQSVVFNDHHSNSNFTTPGISSILNGARPWVHRAFQLGAKPLPGVARHGLIPSVYRARYQTFAVNTNMFAASDLHGAGPWVDRQSSGRVDDARHMFMKRVPFAGPLSFFPTIQMAYGNVQSFIVGREMKNRHYDPESAFSEARQMLLNSRVDEPAFLWVHLFPPHDPYATPAPFLKMFDPRPRHLTQADSLTRMMYGAGRDPNFPGVLLGRYDEAIRYVDHHVGQFLDWLKQQGRFDDALIVVTSDHGESFTHGYGGHGGPMLHEELIRVPLLIKLPHQQEGRRVGGLPTEHADILPTILEYLGQPAPSHVEGRSLKQALDGGTMAPAPVYAMNFARNGAFIPLKAGSVAMLEGRYKYIRYLGETKYPFMPKREDGLYDLTADPGELRNLSSEMPDRTARMRAAIDAQVAAHSLPPTLND